MTKDSRDGYYWFTSGYSSEPSIVQCVGGQWYTINEVGPIPIDELIRRGWDLHSRVTLPQ